MKRSEMIEKIDEVLRLNHSKIINEQAEAALKACEDAGMLPPYHENPKEHSSTWGNRWTPEEE